MRHFYLSRVQATRLQNKNDPDIHNRQPVSANSMQTQEMIVLSSAAAGMASTGFLLVLRSSPLTTAQYYLAVVYALFAGMMSLPWIVAILPDIYVFYMPAMLPMLLMLPVSVYRFISALTRDGEPTGIRWWDRVLPLLALCITLGFWWLPMEAKKTLFVVGELPAGMAPAALTLATIVLLVFWCLASLVYLLATLRQLGAFRRRLKDLYSNTRTHEVRWVDWLIVLLVLLWLAAALSLLTDNFSSRAVISGEVVLALGALFLMFLVVFSSAPAPAPTRDPDDESPKYARSALNGAQARQLQTRIERAMKDDALYLDAGLTLQKLADHMTTSPNLVSQTLNEHMGSTFFDYVAHWRIEASKPLITQGEMSVFAIALEVGFNSRSTFYKAFKRETGVTPSAYRKNT